MTEKLRAAARQALEALNQVATDFPRGLTGVQKVAIAALREALAEQPEPEHINSPDCWCKPELAYKDPETEAEVWVHRKVQ